MCTSRDNYETCVFLIFFFFKQKTAYEMRISDWSSDVCSSDLFLVYLGSSNSPGSKRKSHDQACNRRRRPPERLLAHRQVAFDEHRASGSQCGQGDRKSVV